MFMRVFRIADESNYANKMQANTNPNVCKELAMYSHDILANSQTFSLPICSEGKEKNLGVGHRGGTPQPVGKSLARGVLSITLIDIPSHSMVSIARYPSNENSEVYEVRA